MEEISDVPYSKNSIHGNSNDQCCRCLFCALFSETHGRMCIFDRRRKPKFLKNKNIPIFVENVRLVLSIRNASTRGLGLKYSKINARASTLGDERQKSPLPNECN